MSKLLQENAVLRNTEHRKIDWGRVVARIPYEAMPGLHARFPELLRGDRHQRDRALFTILQEHPEWRVVPDGKIWSTHHAQQNPGAATPDGGGSARP